MKAIAKIKQLAQQFGTTQVVLEVNAPAKELEKYTAGEISVTFSEMKKKRTINSNSYYWCLLHKLSLKMSKTDAKITDIYLHNYYLRQCSTPLIICGRPSIMAFDDGEKTDLALMQMSDRHFRPTSLTSCGTRWYQELKGSSQMDREEFALLLDNVIEDCKEQGIETMTPDELARMRALEKESDEREKHTITE